MPSSAPVASAVRLSGIPSRTVNIANDVLALLAATGLSVFKPRRRRAPG
jgi:hypothetical protein